eukprot:gnl/TRDRNA2_/TRDRNA2_208330_c0_seq1.p2 gnl/TRDRNA2_/TRDRNA2_208330_c0~~gnl/TRDRNA2_/TRDRNA2_208330_c0_seq1.p2  ORF type:complete len:114 (-),score=3.43 gnl/TRDRNA2_/TRDRNA2_208330_c0_seq1:35-376(-)
MQLQWLRKTGITAVATCTEANTEAYAVPTTSRLGSVHGSDDANKMYKYIYKYGCSSRPKKPSPEEGLHLPRGGRIFPEPRGTKRSYMHRSSGFCSQLFVQQIGKRSIAAQLCD